MRKVYENAFAVHLGNKFFAKSSQALAGVARMSRRMAYLIVVGVTQCDILHTQLLQLLHSAKVGAYTYAVFHTKEKCFLAGCFQLGCFSLASRNAAHCRIPISLLDGGINQLQHSLVAGVECGLIQFARHAPRFAVFFHLYIAANIGCQELCVEHTLLHLWHIHPILATKPKLNAVLKVERRIGVSVNRQHSAVYRLGMPIEPRLRHKELQQLVHQRILALEPLRMPLNTHCPTCRIEVDGFNHAVGAQSRHACSLGNVFHRLMMRTVHHH